MVSTMAMPMLAPILRIRLKMLVSLPILSLGTGSFVTVVKGTKIKPRPAPCAVSGNLTQIAKTWLAQSFVMTEHLALTSKTA
jgi:hypothetical protein